VGDVVRAAFGRDDEAVLVSALRAGGYARLSLVAEVDGQIVGHVLLSDLPIRAAGVTHPALALAPVAVLPACQRRGVGSQLIRHGLETCRDRAQGARIVIVLGEPEYYRRFGFSSELTRRIVSPFSGKAAWQALELSEGALAGVAGRVCYPPPFGIAEPSGIGEPSAGSDERSAD
jgi:putative acetyltransferase